MKQSNSRRPFNNAALAAVFLACAACNAPKPKSIVHVLEFEGNTMGTTYSVRVAQPPNRFVETPGDLSAIIELELKQVDDHMSTYRADSELSKFNQHADTTPYSISAETFGVFARALEVSNETGGAFDVTVGPLVNAWGFGPGGRPETVPTGAEIAALRSRIGFAKLTLNQEARTIAKGNPAMYCDLSAIAKGWAADQVANALVQAECKNFMVEVGGEVQTRGMNLDGVPWRIAIETPVEDKRGVFAVAGLNGVGMATSGDYRNFYDAGGKRLSHTIDPRTGHPVSHNLASVSVVHAQCVSADAYATALMVMGVDEGFAWASEEGLAAFFITRDVEGALQYKATDAFAPYLAEAPEQS